MADELTPQWRDSMVAEAQRWHDAGHHVLPLKGKRPVTPRWKPLQTQRAEWPWLEKRLRGRRCTGFAIIHTGGLCCLDFDEPGAYEAWAAANPAWGKWATVKTRRGARVYFRHPTARYKDIKGLGQFLAGAGHYSVMPPSFHPDGGQYSMLHEGEIPTLSDRDLAVLLASATHPTHPIHLTHPTQSYSVLPSPIHSSGRARGGGAAEVPVDAPAIEKALADTLPTAPGQRNNYLFELARGLYEAGLRTAAECKPHVKQWWQRARPFITTEDWWETWVDFERAFGRYDPTKAGFDLALARARSAGPVPELDPEYPPAIHLFAALCRELGGMSEGLFYMSCHHAAKVFDVDPKQISRWLRLLQADGLIRLKSLGNLVSGQASEFEWIGGKAGDGVDQPDHSSPLLA